MKRITLFTNGTLIQKCDRLEIWLNEAGIIQREEGDFWWFHGDPIPFGDGNYTLSSEGYASTLDEAMRALVRAAMS